MAARSSWKGFLKVSLINIPIKVFPATDAKATLSFHQLHELCKTRIKEKKWCPHCDREVTNEEIVKGYEFERGRYVVVEKEDFDKVHVESTRVIDLETFTDAGGVDPIYLERAYYLAPDGKGARDPFAVIRDGMQGKAGIGKVALYGREYLVKVEPRGQGLVMYTLRNANEIRSMDTIEELEGLKSSAKPAEVKLAQQVLSSLEGAFDPAGYRDEYQEGLRKVIDAKIEGREVVAEEVAEPTRVVNLMDALRKSLDSVSTSKKKSARATHAHSKASKRGERERAPARLPARRRTA